MKTAYAAIGLVLALSSGLCAAEPEYASRADAEQLVGKAVAAIRKDADKTYAAITAKDKAWVHGDLYPTVYDLQGKVLAHGQNERMVGKNLIDMHDADGKPFVRERMELAKSKARFWQDYSFVDPVTKKIMPKQMYCERLNESVVCAGVYKR